MVGGYSPETEQAIAARYQHESDVSKAVSRIKSERFDIIITGLHIQPVNGREILAIINKWNPDAIRIVTSQNKDPQRILECFRLGAQAFIYEPFDIIEIEQVIERLTNERRQFGELIHLRRASQAVDGNSLIGSSPSIQRIQEAIDLVAPTKSTVLISGESGTGKGVVARLIHRRSQRRDGPFIAVNCGAIPESIIESELFGHERGSFTGAASQSIGLFEQANKGTLFLDEIGELSLMAQVKLLKAIEDRRIRRVGGTREIEIDVRIVAATNKDLQKKIRDNSFREDLYYRLNVFSIQVPPLRDRRADIFELAMCFNEIISGEIGVKTRPFTPATKRILEAGEYPGNVRELRNIIERAIISSHNQDSISIASDHLLGESAASSMPTEQCSDMLAQVEMRGLDDYLGQIEKTIINQALERCDGNKTKAASLLKIKRTTLAARIAGAQ